MTFFFWHLLNHLLPGLGAFAVGFAVETLADAQKFVFRLDPRNEGKFITTGLWAASRHPNYFGEIVLWWGVYVYALPALRGYQHLAVLSPTLVTLLLSFGSGECPHFLPSSRTQKHSDHPSFLPCLVACAGVPILEKAAHLRWGDDEEYIEYKRTTPVLIPFIQTKGLEYVPRNHSKED